MNTSNIQATLGDILREADDEDLDVLVDYITDSGKGRISLEKESCAQLVGAKSIQRYMPAERMLVEREVRNFGGNTAANLIRSVRYLLGSFAATPANATSGSIVPAVSYDEIVRDVASHLHVKFDKYVGTPEVEDGIIKALLATSLEKMALHEREVALMELDIPNATDLARQGGIAMGAGLATAALSAMVSFNLSRSVATAASQALLGRALVGGMLPVVIRPLAVLAGPIGWAVTGAWALADMASPAYRVTVPCVVQIAYMRKKLQMARDQPISSSQLP